VENELVVRRSKPDALADRLRDLDGAWNGDIEGLLTNRGIQPTAYDDSIGTIGGGNHFAELQRIERLVNPGGLRTDWNSERGRIPVCSQRVARTWRDNSTRAHGAYGAKGLPAGSSEALHTSDAMRTPEDGLLSTER
jgi:release factor H-coupled RctB family protein